MRQAFRLTFMGTIFEWFQRLRKGSLIRWSTRPIHHALAKSRVRKKEKSHLWSIKQGIDESLQKNLTRLTNKSNKVGNYDDNDVIVSSLTSFERVSNNIPSQRDTDFDDRTHGAGNPAHHCWRISQRSKNQWANETQHSHGKTNEFSIQNSKNCTYLIRISDIKIITHINHQKSLPKWLE